MRFSSLLAGCIVAFDLVTSGAASAAPVNIVFDFTNVANDGGIVTGIIRGLQSDGAGQQASTVEVLTNTGGFGIGTYGPNSGENSWTLSGGVLENGTYESFGLFSPPPFVQDSSIALQFLSPSGTMAGLTNSRFSLSSTSESGITFAVTPVPLPMTAGALGAGILALVCLGRRPPRRPARTIASL